MKEEEVITEKTTKRWTASKKKEVVLRYMQGASIDDLSREIGMESFQIEEWHQVVMSGMEASLKSQIGSPLSSELDFAKKRIGELSMENELLRERSRRNGVFLGGKWK